MAKKSENLKGKKFGKLTPIQPTEKRGKSSSTFWICKCDCGGEHIASAQNLKMNGVTKCKKCRIKTDEELLREAMIRFEKNVEKTATCWIWKGCQIKGYGVMFLKKPIKAHRFSFMIYNGNLDSKKLICHTCDNPLCVNPKHLFQGTCKENAQDALKKNRLTLGSRSHYSKLTDEQVDIILTSKEKGVDLARQYCVNKNTISRIRTGRHWKHKTPSGGGLGRY